MKVALINDLHFDIANFSQPHCLNQTKFYEKVFFPELGSSQKLDTLIIGGDLFDHRKHVTTAALKYWKEHFFDILHERNIKTYVFDGNHDVFLRNSNDISSVKELLYGYSNVIYISKPSVISNTQIGCVPWINNSNYEQTLKWLQTTHAKIIYGHFELKGFEMYKGYENEHGMDASIFSRFHRVWSGHFHQPSTKSNISYLSAPCQYTWGDSGCDRGFNIYDIETDTLEYIKNPYELFIKYTYDETKDVDYSVFTEKYVKIFVNGQKDQVKFDKFIEGVNLSNPYQVSIIDQYIVEDISEEEVNVQNCTVKELIEKYSEGFTFNLDKDVLKSKLKELCV